MAGERFQIADGRVFTLREALVVTAVSAVVPGFAHLRSGRRGAGLAPPVLYGAVAAAGTILPAALSAALSGPERRFLVTAAAASWVALILVSYRAVRPATPPLPARAAAGAAVAALCVLAAVVPPALARYAGTGARPVHGALRPRAVVTPAAPPPPPAPAGPARLNLLLAARGERSALVLASVDARTGDTVLLPLPGDLLRVPVRGVPAGLPLASVYRYGTAHPAIAGHAGHPGARLLKRAVGEVTGMPVGYYRVIDGRRLRRLVAGRRAGLCTDGSHLLAAELGHGHATAGSPPSPVLVALSSKIRDARVHGVRLVSSRIDHTRPDYGRLRAKARRATVTRTAPTDPHHDSRIPGDMCG